MEKLSMFARMLWSVIASIPLLLNSLPAAGADAAARDAIAKLLEVGWSVTPQARAAADEQYDELARVAPGDRRALAASLLVMLQQRRFDAALERAEALLAKDAADLTALRAKVWISTLLKNYEGAMLAADQLSRQIAARPATTEEEQAAHDELFVFLGRIYGYLGGPVADAVSQDQRKAAEKEILGRIVETRRALFEEARDGVVGKFVAMTGERDDERVKAAAAADAAKDKTLAELEEERQKIDDRTRELEDRQNKLKSELRDELAEIAKEDRPLVQELARLEARAGSLNRELAALDIQIGQLRAEAQRERNETVRFQLLREADRLVLFARRTEGDLLGVNRLADGVQGQRAGLAARQRKAQSSTADQLKRIEQELGGLAKRDRRNDAIEKRAARPASGVTSKSRALAAQAAALTTYDQFPLEAAKAQLLKSLK
jgi:DNA repair exonuclease SbcCD ATPase subunit